MGGGGPMSGGAGMPTGAMPADVLEHVQQYKAALARDPKDVQANIGYGNLLFDSGQWENATKHYQAALEKAPGNADVRVDMAIALHNLGQDPKAIQELERVTREAPGHKNAWLNLGVICSGTGDRKTAIRAWERYLALDPNGPHAASIREQVQQLKAGA
jgi:DNA-directed RNA polymerase subunit alpha